MHVLNKMYNVFRTYHMITNVHKISMKHFFVDQEHDFSTRNGVMSLNMLRS